MLLSQKVCEQLIASACVEGRDGIPRRRSAGSWQAVDPR